LYSPISRFITDDDYPWGFDAERRAEWVEQTYWHWGEGAPAETLAPSLAEDPEFVAWYGRLERLSLSPGAVRETMRTVAEQAARLGDREWTRLLDEHRALVRAELARHGGREVKTLGDGFLADFDGPARAIRCALAVADGSAASGLEIRAGVHTGEVERVNG